MSEGWRKLRLKDLFRSVRNGLWGNDPTDDIDTRCVRGTDFDRLLGSVSKSGLPRRQFEPTALLQHRLERGDLVLEKSGGSADQPVGSVALFDLDIVAVCSNFNARLRVSPDVSAGFARYLLNGLYYTGLTRRYIKQTTGIQNLDTDAFMAHFCNVPSIDIQESISTYLDAELSKIDRLVVLRNAQLERTVERESVQIYQAVRGVGPGVESRPSGISWLGEVAHNFRLAAVSHEYEVMLGKMLNEDRVTGEHLRPYLRNVNVQWDRIDVDDLLEMNFPPAERKRYSLQAGDLLVCEGGEPGRAAIWSGAVDEIYYQKALHRVRPRGSSSVRWLFYCLRAATHVNLFTLEGNSATIAHLTAEQLKVQRFPFPDRTTQDRLVAQLDEQGRGRQAFRSTVERQLALLAERRQALVLAAVTGQIDVSTAGRAV
jgi:type I restriction enzyme, S subunit